MVQEVDVVAKVDALIAMVALVAAMLLLTDPTNNIRLKVTR